MSDFGKYDDIEVSLTGHVALLEMQRPPHNYFDVSLIEQLATALERLGETADCRVIVLAAQGKSFCAGASFGDGNVDGGIRGNGAAQLYQQAVRLFRSPKPIVAAIQGAAIGGGLGLAVMCDFRIACPESRFSANFTLLGFHPGFGLTATLPRLIGHQKAALMFYTSRRIKGQEAFEWGLADVLVPLERVREAAIELATEISCSAPLGVVETRATVRRGLAETVKTATEHELKVQMALLESEDFEEGIKAAGERRQPVFQGR